MSEVYVSTKKKHSISVEELSEMSVKKLGIVFLCSQLIVLFFFVLDYMIASDSLGRAPQSFGEIMEHSGQWGAGRTIGIEFVFLVALVLVMARKLLAFYSQSKK